MRLRLIGLAAVWMLSFSNLAAHEPPETRTFFTFAHPSSFVAAKVARALDRLAQKEDDYVHIHTPIDEVDWLALVERPFVTVHDSVLADASAWDAQNPEAEWFIADFAQERAEKKRRRKTKLQNEFAAEWDLFVDDDEWELEFDEENIEEELSAMEADHYAELAQREADSLRAWAMETDFAEDDSPEDDLEITETQTDPLWGALALADDLVDELWNLWCDARPSPEGIYGFYFFPDDDEKEIPPANPGFGGFVPR